MSDLFRTPIRIPASPIRITLQHQVCSIGSCFAEHLHDRFMDIYFKSYCNPCGIVYNPVSIAHQLNALLTGRVWDHQDLLYHDGLYHGLHHHGSFSDPDPNVALRQMNRSSTQAAHFLQHTNLLIITLGTAIVYRHLATDTIVANCHKLPASEFERSILTPEAIVAQTQSWLDDLIRQFPNINVLFTISPVRYLKEGFTDNSCSKASLILAVHTLCTQNVQVHYFPAYEILLDDLRDYRFYKEDLVHPNDQAIDYIWDQFKKTYCDRETIAVMKTLQYIKKAKAHRPLHPNTSAHHNFLTQLDRSIAEVRTKYPWLEID